MCPRNGSISCNPISDKPLIYLISTFRSLSSTATIGKQPTKNPDQSPDRGFLYPKSRLVRNAASPANSRNPYPLANTEYFIFLNLLHIGAHAAVVFTNGDFHALGAGQAFFSG